MRKILVLLSILLVTVLFLEGCGFSSWQDEETAREIKSINRIVDTATGEVFLQVVYSDDTTSDKFSLPAGVSVTNVKSSYSSTDRKTTVTFEFSDGKTQQSFTIPDGKDGTRVVDVAINPDGSGTPYLYFYFSDGTQSDGVDISLLKGENGVDGKDGVDGENGSTWYFGKGAPKNDVQSGEPSGGEESVENGENVGSTTESSSKAGDYYLNTDTYQVYVKKSDGTWELLGCLKGSGMSIGYTGAGSELGALEIIMTDYDENGNAVERDPIYIYSSAVKSMSVVYNKKSGMYEYRITVSMVDGQDKDLDLIEVQRPSTWFYGDDTPKDGQETLKDVKTFDGDFYYAKNRGQIYIKQDGKWVSVITLESGVEEIATCVITFDPQRGTMDSDPNAYPASGGRPKITVNADKDVLSVEVVVKKGQCYPSESYSLPEPTRDGYTFKGWYKTKDISFGNAPFTDMVPVYENITLYAVWEPNNA